MRRFSSYGPVDTDLHYYCPRKELIDKGFAQFLGQDPGKGGHYFTVWAPRQCGKTWVMQQAVKLVRQTGLYEVAICSVGRTKEMTEEEDVMKVFIEELQYAFRRPLPLLKKISDLHVLFTKEYFKKPVIVALDEFDAMEEVFISRFANSFRELYIKRTNELDLKKEEKSCLLHGLALIGVRSVLGIENKSGSPFNVQRSLKIPNLTFEEVSGLFKWYEKESGQHVEPNVIDRIYYEMNGQPGITCWFGELLSEGFEFYKNDTSKPITMSEFSIVYAGATYALPNNNIMNLISKAKDEENKEIILKMFQTNEKVEFRFDNKTMNALYMNGLIEPEFENQGKYFMKFPSPFVQKRLFNYFSNVYFNDMGTTIEPLTNLRHIITPDHIDIIGIMKFYQQYLEKNRGWMFKHAPRRSDQRLFEAVFHFNLYAYLTSFFYGMKVQVFPEFPTGNGKIDLILRYNEHIYGIELKSFRNEALFQDAQEKAAHYGKQLGLSEIFLVSFIESIDEETRTFFEKPYLEPESGVTVKPFFILTGVI